MNDLCGRFAPTPSGPLHFGSLVTALASFLSVRSRGGRWLVRIEDTDRERTVSGASDQILRSLESLSLNWDGEVLFQSRRENIYHEKMVFLLSQGVAYRCSCSRKSIGSGRGLGVDGTVIYPGTCRIKPLFPSNARVVRCRVPNEVRQFCDERRGVLSQNLEESVGDFVIFRADGCFAYNFAVVIDDAMQGVTEVMRGSDLLDSTLRQIYLQEVLGLPTPKYYHLPLVINEGGAKLSKQTFAQPILEEKASENLFLALRFLGQRPPQDLRGEEARTVVKWGVENFKIENIPLENREIPSR
jgi:glutamyl-Q tRNA(Asp) synthetase